MIKKVIENNFGLAVIIAMCLGAGVWFNGDRLKSEPLKPTTIIEVPKVEAEAEGKSITPASTSPLDADDPFKHKQSEEEVMASIVRNACLQRCPSGTVPVFVGDEIVGFFNHESASMTHFNLGERLNL